MANLSPTRYSIASSVWSAWIRREEEGGWRSNTEMTLDRTGLAPTSQLSCSQRWHLEPHRVWRETSHEGIQGPRLSQQPKLNS
ncbi:hypothetical protein BO85DRAFT_444227 [Aspergillus piperis CBS 112811]|uniref:Uncharacterized protein n=1 Tax=Aspergillus piperis CBS 112811 TaxID=1448313 RepID=A0A8G1RB40_9EURO|nr:hypothetical protein BO85DRAFT_444227 [Aspergillus piperis CBS 112811]RAH62889.1 hypothetical protein BO85DRAFT_444227 [Aspergillus piperis CBS 112811]